MSLFFIVIHTYEAFEPTLENFISMNNYEGMDAKELSQIIKDGETMTVEFKRGDRKKLNDNDIVEAAVCLANGQGGLLLIGVEDDGTVTGIEPRHGETTLPHRLQAMILNLTQMPLSTEVSMVEIEGLPVAVVKVPREEIPVGTKSGKYLKRSLRSDGEPECVAYPVLEMIANGMTAMGHDYAATTARGATMADLDPLEFERLRRLCATGRGDRVLADLSDEEILTALHMRDPNRPQDLTLGAILTFGTSEALSRYVPTAEVLFQELRGTRIVTNETLTLPLLRAAERLYDLVDARNSEQEFMAGMHRVAIPRIPVETIRESVANALVHRDYSELGPVVVQLTDDTFRVRSPGGLPSGITLETIVSDSKPRSALLAEAFKRAGIVDRAGRGVPKMYLAALRAGRGVPDYSASTPNAVIVEISTSDADLEMARFVARYEDEQGVQLTLPQLQVLRELKEAGPQSPAELADATSETGATVRASLARLTELGLVEARGTGRARRYHLTSFFFREAEASEYVRLIGMDQIQQEQMILSYIREFGSIARSQVAELCALSPTQAGALLRKMTDSGAIEMRGERRGAHYVMPESGH